MKTTIRPTGENQVELTVEVPAEAVRRAFDRTVARLRSGYQREGFRKGRVPVALMLQDLGVDYVRGEALEDAIPEWGDQALRESGLWEDAVGTTDLKVGPLDENADYSFTLTVQTMPTPELGEYKGLRVPRRSVEVREEQVDAHLALLQERLASLRPVEGRPVQAGDFVLIDYRASRDGEPVEGVEGRDQMVEVGRGRLLPEFEEALPGTAVGEEKTFDVTFPDGEEAGELAGQTVTFAVTVKEIKEKAVPELDDAFAADVSEFETMDELRADIRRRLEAAAEAAAQREFREAAVDRAVANAAVSVPSTMVERETERLYHRLEQRVGEQGLTMDVYLQLLQKTREEVEEELRPQAEALIKRQLVLEAIAEAEGLSVSDDEIAEVVKRDAELLGRDHLQLLADLEKSGRREALRAEMLLAKAADFVAGQAVPAPAEGDEGDGGAAAAGDAAAPAGEADDTEKEQT